MSDDHHDGDAGLTAQVIAGFGRTPGPRLCKRCPAWRLRAFVVDRS
ncbi:hypothetical protein [Burkholderia cepacia]|nr:hypothetical protein [Burkholderia cepacia]